MSEGAAGFWSYVREDNAGDDGRILALADDLRAQYRILTAEDLELFVDRDSIQWGEEWTKRISDAIAGTTFFIPIVTPSYFVSNACRQELLKFVRDATRLGLEQLLMPVYWATVTELEGDAKESSDEAIRAVGQYNWQDLRDERLEDRGSSEYRKAVSKLAAELAKRAAEVRETVEDVPLESEPDEQEPDENGGNGAPGIIEHIAKSEEAMPHLTEVMEAIGKDIQLVGNRVEQAGSDIDAATKRGQGMKAALTVTEKLARDLEAPASRIEENGHEYAATLAELDPGIHARLDLLEGQDKLDEEQTEFLGAVEQLAETSDEALTRLEGMVEEAKTMATLSRSLRSPLKKLRVGVQGVLDGRAIIEEWGRRARELKETRPNQSDKEPPATDVGGAENGELSGADR